MAPAPPFPAFLLPSFPFPRPARARHSTTSSVASDSSVPSLSSSPASSRRSSTISVSPPPTPRSASRARAPDPRRLRPTQPTTLQCASCSADLAFSAQIVSKGFTGRHGRAYLVSPLPPADLGEGRAARPSVTSSARELLNIRVGRAVHRQFVTGAHLVADISCRVCGTMVGWKYVDAREASQRYKIGKFILETKRVVPCAHWDEAVEPAAAGDGAERPASPWGTEPPDSARGSVVDDEVGSVNFDSDDSDECEELFAGIWDPETTAKRRRRRVTAKGYGAADQ